MIATAEDDWSREQWLSQARWYARLSDGTVCFSDDGRPGVEESSWARLAAFLREGDLSLAALWLRFRGEGPARLPEGAPGYFFRRAVLKELQGGPAVGLFLAGWLEGGKVKVLTYRVPELSPFGSEERDPADPEKVGPSLIKCR